MCAERTQNVHFCLHHYRQCGTIKSESRVVATSCQLLQQRFCRRQQIYFTLGIFKSTRNAAESVKSVFIIYFFLVKMSALTSSFFLSFFNFSLVLPLIPRFPNTNPGISLFRLLLCSQGAKSFTSCIRPV